MTEPKKEPTPEEEWAMVGQLALRAEARELAERPIEEVERGLRAGGIDPERVARDGRAFAERLMREAGMNGPDRDHDHHERDPDRESDPDPPDSLDDDRVAHAQPVIPFPSRLSGRWPLLFAAAAVGAVAIPTGITIALRDRPRPLEIIHDETPVRHEPSPTELAANLRREANDACAKREWQACLDKLDDARQIDVVGDETPAVERLRASAVLGLTPPELPSDKLDRKTVPRRDP
jgi:hypothetical protein